jgi:hypothetical protein
MKRLVSILAAAAVLAVAAPAAARGCDDDHRAQVPRPVPARAIPYERWDVRWDHRAGARAHELRELRQAYRALDAERAAYHARWAGRPGKLRKFDRYYASEKARLDQRWHDVTAFAYAAR